MPKITLLLLVALLSACASPPASRLFDAASLAEYPHPLVLITDKPKGKVIAGVYTEDVRTLIHVMERVEKAAGPMHPELMVEDRGEPNGFSFLMHGQPKIAVNISMINLIGQDEDALAALLGHELAHLYLKHGNLRQNREENRMVGSVALSFALGMIGIPAPVELTNVATTAVSNSFSREEEREADRSGVDYMIKAGFNPWGAVRLQEKLREVAKSSALPFLSTHPSNEERIENMRNLALASKQESAPPLVSDGTLEKVETITLPPQK